MNPAELEWDPATPWDDDEDGCISAVPAHELHQALGLVGRPQAGLPAGTVKAWKKIGATFPELRHLGAWGDRSHKARRSCHNTGRAIDIMTTDQKMHARLAAWLLANRAELGVTLIISRRRKWSAASRWAPVAYRGTSPHTDHVHVSILCKG